MTEETRGPPQRRRPRKPASPTRARPTCRSSRSRPDRSRPATRSSAPTSRARPGHRQDPAAAADQPGLDHRRHRARRIGPVPAARRRAARHDHRGRGRVLIVGLASRMFMRIPPGTVGLVARAGRHQAVLEAGDPPRQPVPRADPHRHHARAGVRRPGRGGQVGDGVNVNVDLVLTLGIADPVKLAYSITTRTSTSSSTPPARRRAPHRPRHRGALGPRPGTRRGAIACARPDRRKARLVRRRKSEPSRSRACCFRRRSPRPSRPGGWRPSSSPRSRGTSCSRSGGSPTGRT